MSVSEEEEEVCGGCGAAVLDIDVRCGSCGISLSSTGAQRLVGSVVLEQYEVVDILGQGGMSVVYRGRHKITQQEVALKVLPPELAAYKDVKGRFMEEGRALAKLDHPNIVHLYNFGDDGNCLVLAMQFVRGDTWERMILEQGKLDWRRSVELTRDVSNALDYAHGRGIIHRDMKPSNVLVRELDGAATVMDFGIAKMQSSTKLTAEGQTMGTVRYMSPEQVRGVSVGVETDIYSLAMTAYESLVGDTPFTGETHFEIMTKHLSEAPVPPSERGVDLPPALETILMRAISKAPSDRQSSALELKEQLQAVLDGNEPQNINLDPDATRSLGAKKSEKDAHAAPTDASPVDDHLDDLPVGIRPRRGLALMALGGLVLAAGAATFVLTRESEKTTAAPKTEKGAGGPVEAVRTQLPTTSTAFKMPGLVIASDQDYKEEGLRLLTTGEISAAALYEQVVAAKTVTTDIAKEEGWPLGAISSPLAVVAVSQEVLCNPNLYEHGKIRQPCNTAAAHYRPHERTLYVVPGPDGKYTELPFWITYVHCVSDNPPDNCGVVLNSRFPKR